MHQATYSPEDNKLRLYPESRLPKEEYDRVKAAGFKWAPKQEIFVAPMWTPGREDLLVEMCGEIGDEDKSLVERTGERAERFRDYSASRTEDAEHAHKAVSSICDGIPFGQPILVGHHSEKHARRDAERIENGMQRAIKMWDTAEYWKGRAAGAIAAAKYKERPDVRARRIKGIEADQRKQERSKKESERWVRFWEGKLVAVKKTGEKHPLTITEGNRELIVHYLGGCSGGSPYHAFPLVKYPRQLPASQYEGEMGLWTALGGSDGPSHAVCTLEQARDLALADSQRGVAWADRWLEHYARRLEYERYMLAGDGGTVTDRKGPEVGGGCKCWASHRAAGWRGSIIASAEKIWGQEKPKS